MKEDKTYQAYYTKSDAILNYMTNMLNLQPHDKIFEPCGGDGVFVEKILQIIPSANIDIYELNPNAISILASKYKQNNNIHIKQTDTLLDQDILDCNAKYDKIIGNPPYGAHSSESKKEHFKNIYAGLYTKESYTLFLYACTKCLKENGELSFIIPDTFLSLHRHKAIRKYLLRNTRIKELALFPSSFFPGIHFGYSNLCIITLAKCSNPTECLNNSIRIRTNFNNVKELAETKAGTVKNIIQQYIYDSVDYSFIYKSSNVVTELINDDGLKKIGDIADCVTGFYSGNDKKYLHPINKSIKNAKKYETAPMENVRTTTLTKLEQENGITSAENLVPIVKGGNIAYVKPNIWFMDWSAQAIKEYKQSKKCRFQNSSFYFKNGIGIPMIRSSRLTGALIDGRLFDQSIVGVFPKDSTWLYYLLGFFNSSICTEIIEAINPSTNNSANYIKKIPFLEPDDDTKEKVEKLVFKILENKVVDTNIQSELDAIFYKLYINKDGITHQYIKKQRYIQLDLFSASNNVKSHK